MAIRRFIVPVALMFALAATSASAAQRSRGGERRAPRESGGQAGPARGGGGRVAEPRSYQPPRAEGRRDSRPGGVSPRGDDAPRGVRPYDRSYGYRSYGDRSYGYRSYGYRSYGYRSYPRYYYSRPYYVFRPRLSLGFGIWVGDPVPYPYIYAPYGYPYPDPYTYSYPESYPGYPPAQYPSSQYPQAYPTQPGTTVSPSAVGGVSFEITPSNAAVYVDGQYAGVVNDFNASAQPLSLAPGRHHIELQADGFIPLGFDVDVVAGQVIPYRGDLQRD